MRRVLLVVALSLLSSACNADTGAEPSSPPEPATSLPSTTTLPTSTTTSTADESRWIEVSGTEFIDTRTGQPFAPRGVNLLLKLGGGGGDRLFSNYDRQWVDGQLDAITALGFNTVRFFLDMCMECTSDASGIKDEYLDNLADLFTRLEGHGLIALPTSNDVPDPGYSDRLPCCEPFGGYRNSLYLSPEGHQIAVEYWTDLIAGIRERDAPTHHLLGWELANEQFVQRDVAPISLSEGTVTAADGNEYDMSDEAAVEAMVVSSLRSFIATVGDAIRSVDEGAHVTMGFFSAEDPEAGQVAADNRWVVPDDVIDESTLDFVDLHAYPGLGGTWSLIGPAYGLGETAPGYPLLLGEFGAFESAYSGPEEAAAAMARFQAESCAWGFGGWLLWFWGADQDDEVVTADAHDAAVARAISPEVRPDPCDIGSYASANLALDRPVTASAEESDEYAAGRVVDGSDATWWSAADGAPQWVEIDLEEERTVDTVQILIGDVSPPGPQTHRVYLRGADEAAPGTLVGEISADASHGEWLTVEIESLAEVRFVRVETVAVDGWVILHEIEVLGG